MAFVVIPPSLPTSVIHINTRQQYHHHHSDTKSKLISVPSNSIMTSQRQRIFGVSRSSSLSSSSSPFSLYASSSSSSKNQSSSSLLKQAERRKVLLSRTGPHFKVDRMKGVIEFGATANLITQLPPSPPLPPPILPTIEDGTAPTTTATSMIDLWLLDENRGLAMSIWDPKLMKDLGNKMYRLQIMTLQFVTITLAPWVDMQMMTIMTNNNKPEFIVQSIDFDPNIQILPGMRIDGNALGIVIEVAGVLRPGSDGASVTGAIAFQTSGKLPPPLRLLPDAVLKAASDTINNTIVNFAIQSFQKGAKMNYQQFLQQYEQNRKKTSSQ